MVKLRSLREHGTSTNMDESGSDCLTYSTIGGKEYYAKYQAFVLSRIDSVTAEFYGEDSVTGIFWRKSF